MRNLSKFIILNNINRKKNFFIVPLISLLSCLCAYFMKTQNLQVQNKDYFFVVWFILSMYYIYLISDISTYDFENKIINFIYSAGFSRSKYLLNKILLISIIGLIHGLLIFLIYKFIFLTFIVSPNETTGLIALLIYPLIFILIGLLDTLLALFDFSKAKIIMINFFIIVAIPAFTETLLISIDNQFLLDLYSASPFVLLSKNAIDLNLTLPVATATLICMCLLILSTYIKNKLKNL